MEYFGFERENTGEFTYQQADKKEQERRKSGVNEIKKLTDDLKHARSGTLNGFQEFIRVDENIKSFISLRFSFVESTF